MKEGFCPLASGSRGNSIYFGTKRTKILVDAGISAKATISKLAQIDVDLSEIQAILISHEHTDHIAGLKTLAFRYKIPVLANAETAKGIYAALSECPKFRIFTTGETFTFGDIEIHPFSVQHDTQDPVAFSLKTGSIKVGICTDLGCASSQVSSNLQKCDYLYIEANHEPSMVHASSRPMIYKQRVLSKSGHLSNEQAGDLIKEVLHDELKHIHLAHLSQECNTPQRAIERVKEKIGDNIPLSVAPQHEIAKAVIFDEVENCV